MSASMLLDLEFISDQMLSHVPSTKYDPCEILIALEDRDDAEWSVLGYSRAEFIKAHINGDI